MLTKDARNETYNRLINSFADLAAITRARGNANPSMKKAQDLDEAAADTLEKLVAPLTSLVMSSIEALHVIAEAQRDLASTYRTVNSLPVKE